MKAVIATQYGTPDVLRVQDVPQPTPRANEVLVRVQASTVGYGDLVARNFSGISPQAFNMPFILWLLARVAMGLRGPRQPIFGAEFAGVVEAVGSAVSRFSPGDAVFGYRGQRQGSHAEFVCMAESGLIAHKPANLSFAEAATVPYGALTALSLLRRANIQPGQKVLILGASGGIGAAAVQLAKLAGAHVTGVCSAAGLNFVKALGADRVLDYTHEDYTRSGETYDLIFDVLGRGSFARSRRSLRQDGRYLYASFKSRQLLQMLWTGRFSRQKVICALSSETQDDLRWIADQVTSGQYRAFVGRQFPMEQAAEAHRFAESGQKAGPIVLTIGVLAAPVNVLGSA